MGSFHHLEFAGIVCSVHGNGIYVLPAAQENVHRKGGSLGLRDGGRIKYEAGATGATRGRRWRSVLGRRLVLRWRLWRVLRRLCARRCLWSGWRGLILILRCGRWGLLAEVPQ